MINVHYKGGSLINFKLKITNVKIVIGVYSVRSEKIVIQLLLDYKLSSKFSRLRELLELTLF